MVAPPYNGTVSAMEKYKLLIPTTWINLQKKNTALSERIQEPKTKTRLLHYYSILEKAKEAESNLMTTDNEVGRRMYWKGQAGSY